MEMKDGHFFVTEKVSEHREKTPEGYLLCRDVAISRVGTFEYTAEEVGVQSSSGKVMLSRTEDELFSPETMASFEGKPVVVGHDTFATPKNWRDIAVGIVQNVRRGDGENSDQLLADLLLTDERGIKYVESGELLEVSCGYDARPVIDGDGVGHQEGIVGNHLALVTNARCGHVCKIKDGTMANLKDLFARLFRDGNEQDFMKQLDQVSIQKLDDDDDSGNADYTQKVDDQDDTTTVDNDTANDDKQVVDDDDGDNQDAQPSVEDRIAELTQQIADIREQLEQMRVADDDDDTNDDTNDGEPKQTDGDDDDENIVDEDEVRDVMDGASVVCGDGFKRPTADAKDGRFTVDAINRIRRQVIAESGITVFGDADSLDSAALATAFKGVVAMTSAQRNPSAHQTVDSNSMKKTVSINELNHKYWGV